MNLPILVDEARPMEKKKKTELLDKLNANAKLLLKLKQELEKMKINFHNRVGVDG